MSARRLFALAMTCCLAAPGWAADPPLVTRGRIQLNLAGAETILARAKAKAADLGLKGNIARMDGGRPASGATALTKAASAATFRQETGALPAKGEPDLLLSLSLPAAAL